MQLEKAILLEQIQRRPSGVMDLELNSREAVAATTRDTGSTTEADAAPADTAKANAPPAEHSSSSSQHTSEDLPELYICKKCSREFDTKRQRINHQRSHDGTKYECDECSKNYSDLCNLKRHKRDKHGIGEQIERPLVCEKCGQAIATAGALTRHMRHQHG